MLFKQRKRDYSQKEQSLAAIDRRSLVTASNANASANNRYNLAVYLTISVSVLISIALILTGIFNAQRTSEVADKSIARSLKLQQLNDSLEIHQEAMSAAVEFAITSGESQWRNNYENSLLHLQESLSAVGESIDLPIAAQIRSGLANIVQVEREIFRRISTGDQAGAFSLLASDKYQEKKVGQEQQSLTLRATLSKESTEVIETLKTRLKRTTIALTSQLALMIAIWSYVVHFLRKWQQTQAAHNQELKKLAHYDSLTGIGNRALFHIKLAEAFERAENTGTSVGLILMDIDHFKDINDSLGHEMGDKLLKYFANELNNACRSSDTVIRLGGDEFAIILCDVRSENYTAVFCKKILSLFNRSVYIQDQPIKTGTSIGVSFYPKDANQADGLLRKADLALYEAKRTGRAQYQFFNESIETRAKDKLDMLEAIEHAVDNDEFELAYQPIINLRTNEIIGVESLIRWRRPGVGLVNPADFISLAEESGLIMPIGKWVLRSACFQQLKWKKELGISISISVNLSGVQFHQMNLLSDVENALNCSGIETEKLTLEITESTLMETEGDVVEKLNALRSLGIKLSIDDFGTGYSSLAYLKRFPINFLKLDKAFVSDLPEDRRDVAIARSVITMAHELGVEVVAEGIEEIDQLNFLTQAGCDRGQGYYYGKPMTANEFSHYLMSSSEIDRIAPAQ